MGLMYLPRFYQIDGPSGIGGPSGPGGLSGGFGGGPGGPSGDFGTANDINQGVNSDFGYANELNTATGRFAPDSSKSIQAAIDALNTEMSNQAASQGARGLRGTAIAVASILGFALGGLPGAVTLGALTARGFTQDRAMSMIAAVKSGQDPNSVASQSISQSVKDGSIGNDGKPTGGGPGGGSSGGLTGAAGNAPKSEPKDPASTDFWTEFTQEWQNEKENIRKNDEFRKDTLQPAFDQYQKRMSGMSTEKGFSPINIGMGDFRTSFMPKRGMQAAKDILSSEMAETDLMQPENANREYLQELMGLAKFQEELKNRVQITNIQKREPDDKGTLMDTINDAIGLGDNIGNVYDNLFGDRS